MKRLQPKNTVKTKTTITDNLVSELREKLKTHIAMLVPKLYEKFGWAKPDFEEEEDWAIPTGYLEEKIYINVEVDNSYLDVEERCYEDREMSEVVVALDGNVIVRDEDEGEWFFDELSTDEVARIANSLEKTFWKTN